MILMISFLGLCDEQISSNRGEEQADRQIDSDLMLKLLNLINKSTSS